MFRCGIFRIGVLMTRSGSDVRSLLPVVTGCEAVERPEPEGEALGRRAVGGVQSRLTLGVRGEALHGSCGSSTRPWRKPGAGQRGEVFEHLNRPVSGDLFPCGPQTGCLPYRCRSSDCNLPCLALGSDPGRAFWGLSSLASQALCPILCTKVCEIPPD